VRLARLSHEDDMGESKRCQRARLDDVNGSLAHLRRHSGKGLIQSAYDPESEPSDRCPSSVCSVAGPWGTAHDVKLIKMVVASAGGFPYPRGCGRPRRGMMERQMVYPV